MKYIDEKQLLFAVGEVGDDLIARAEQPVKKRSAPYVRFGALAACFCLIAVLAVLPHRMGAGLDNNALPPMPGSNFAGSSNGERSGDEEEESILGCGDPGSMNDETEGPGVDSGDGAVPESAPEDESKGLPVLVGPGETSLQAIHICGGQMEETYLTGETLAALRTWADGVLPGLEAQSFAEGQSPGDSDGGEVYSFTGENTDFSYVINGPAEHWVLLANGQWYAVTEPAIPPVEFDQRS